LSELTKIQNKCLSQASLSSLRYVRKRLRPSWKSLPGISNWA